MKNKFSAVLAAGLMVFSAIPFSAAAEETTTTDYSQYSIGDVNLDGVIDAIDATEILYFYADENTGKVITDERRELMLALGDLDNDGDATPLDSSAVLQLYAEISTADVEDIHRMIAEWEADWRTSTPEEREYFLKTFYPELY